MLQYTSTAELLQSLNLIFFFRNVFLIVLKSNEGKKWHGLSKAVSLDIYFTAA